MHHQPPPRHAGGTKPVSSDTQGPALAEADRLLLAFEDRWPGHTWEKDRAMRVELRLAPTVYYQRLRLVVTDPAAVEAFPVACSRYQAGVDAQRARRATRSF